MTKPVYNGIIPKWLIRYLKIVPLQSLDGKKSSDDFNYNRKKGDWKGGVLTSLTCPKGKERVLP